MHNYKYYIFKISTKNDAGTNWCDFVAPYRIKGKLGRCSNYRFAQFYFDYTYDANIKKYTKLWFVYETNFDKDTTIMINMSANFLNRRIRGNYKKYKNYKLIENYTF